MLEMAKKSSKPSEGRARKTGKTRLVTFELDAALDDALEAFSKKDRRSKKAVASIAFEQFLAGKGFWPPPAEEPE